MELTKRQEWKVMRDLVSENNSTIRNVFSSSISAEVYDLFYRKTTAGTGVTKQYVENFKNQQITSGMKSVYKACADNFLINDYFGSIKYLDFQNSNVNWLDQLSTTDLFYYYTLQSRIIKKFNKVENLNTDRAVDIISQTPISKYFSGKVSFTGKPEKTAEDKNKIDIKDFQIRAQVLHDIALSEHQNYCEEHNLDSEELEEVVMTKINFGKYSGAVANRYFKQREFLQQQREEEEKFLQDQAVLEAEKPKWVGFDNQQSPLYMLSNGSYQTSVGKDYNGDIYDLIDDRFVIVGSTIEQDIEGPTDESEIEEEFDTIKYMPLNKRDVEPSTQTPESEQVQ